MDEEFNGNARMLPVCWTNPSRALELNCCPSPKKKGLFSHSKLFGLSPCGSKSVWEVSYGCVKVKMKRRISGPQVALAGWASRSSEEEDVKSELSCACMADSLLILCITQVKCVSVILLMLFQGLKEGTRAVCCAVFHYVWAALSYYEITAEVQTDCVAL